MSGNPTGKPDNTDEVELLRQRLDWMPDWIWEIDLNATITYSNRVVTALLGYTPDEIVGWVFFNLLSETEVSKCQGLFNRAITTGEPISNVITHLRTKASSTRKVELSCVPILDAGNQVIGLRGIARDISAQTSVERLAQEAEANYRTVVENSPTGIFIVQNGLVVYVNPKIGELMGYSREEVLGTPIIQYVHPDDVARLAPYEHLRIAGEDVPAHYVARGIMKSGAVRTFEFRASVIGFEGAPAVLLSAVDITEAQRTEDALRKSEEEYRELVEQISDWVWQVDENAAYTYASPRIRDLLGYEPEEVLGKSAFELMPPDEAKKIAEDIQPTWDRHEPFTLVENPMVHRDGHIVWVETSGEPVFDDKGVFRGYRGIDRDISARKEAEATLRASEQQYRALFDNSPLAMWVFSTESLTFLAVNEAMLKHYGYTRDELIGKSIMDIRPSEEAVRLRGYLTETLRQGLGTGGIWKHKKKDGTLIDVEVTSHTLEWEGKPAVMILANDVSERRRAEKAAKESREKLQAVMNNIPQFVFWKDRNSVYIGCNENFARAAGVGSPEGIVGKSDLDLPWAETQAESYREWDRRVMESDVAEYHIVESQLTAEDTLVIVDTNKVPLHDAEGNVVGILGTYEDITDRVQSEQALLEAEAKYRSLVEETMVGVYLIQDEQFVYANPRMLEIFGCEPEDMIGKSPLDFTAPEDRPRVVESIRKRLEGETKSVRYTFTGLRKDGTPIDVEVHGSITTYRGRAAIIGSLSDITERKRYVAALRDSEERYRQLFEHSPDMVFLISVDTSTFIAMNPTVTRILGYDPYDVLGRKPWDISPEFQPDGQRSVDKARVILEEGRKAAEPQLFEWVHKRKDGTLVDCEVSLVYYRLHDEDLVQAIVRDVTERKHAEEARRKFEREVEVQKRSFYRDTILSVTDGKLNICEYADLEPFIVKAADEVEVNDYSEVAVARRFVDEFVAKSGLTGDRREDFMVGVGEAITNAVKHGEQGRVYVGSDAGCAWVTVSDRGAGIESLILPRAVLLRGFSTKPSLGLGYSIMLEVSDRILLNTGDQGTTVVLMKDVVAQDMTVLPEYLPDTWDNVPG